MDPAAIETAPDCIALVSVDAQPKRQVTCRYGATKGIRTLGPVGEAAQFVLQSVGHLAAR